MIAKSRRHVKPWLSLLLCLSLALGISGCGPQAKPAESPAPTQSAAAEPVEAGVYTPGAYTGTVAGRNGPLTVEVAFDTQSILSVTVKDHAETAGIADVPLERIPGEIVQYQSLGIDTVATATITSQAILDAVADCVTQAGGDSEALKAVIPEKSASSEVKELSADIIIVGGGGAGMSAAVSAARKGADVIMIEKTAALGGNTVRSGGKYDAAYAPTQQNQEMGAAQLEEVRSLATMEPRDELMASWQAAVRQQLADYESAGSTYLFDSPELHMIQTYVDGDYYGNPVLIESFCQKSPETLLWLQDMGLAWKDKAVAVVGSLWQRAQQASDYKSGLGFIDVLNKTIEKESLPVQILLEVTAEDFIMDGGRVTGVKATGADGTSYEFTGDKGVILTTGGFGANVEMRVRYNEQWADLGPSVPTTNSPAITGDGIVMAEKIGANLIDMGLIQLLPAADPVTGGTDTLVGVSTDMYINKNGVRYINETERRDVLSAAALEQPDGCFYIISSQQSSTLDENGYNNYGFHIDDLIKDGKAWRADTLEDLAAQIGVDPEVFVKEVADFNAAVDAGYDAKFERKVFNEDTKIEGAPFYACIRSPAVHHTMGGVQVDIDAHAMDASGSIIPGLYAAGEVTGGYHGGNRLGGNAIPEALVTGRIAGTNAVARK